MSAVRPPVFDPALHDPEVRPSASGSVELPRALLKELHPLGHELERWAAATEILATRVAKGRMPEPLGAFLRQWWPPLSLQWPGGAFTVLLAQTARSWQVLDSSLSWLKQPIWAALLHLPALRSFWRQELRASHFDHLRQRVPEAWLVDPQPLPPGAVIPGLNLPAWQALLDRRVEGRAFGLSPLGSTDTSLSLTPADAATTWQAAIQAALEAGDQVLQAEARVSAWLLARYESSAAGIHLADVWLESEGSLQHQHLSPSR